MTDRFWSLVDKTDDCWLWTGPQNRNGYGMFWANGRHEVAHRAAWRLSGRELDPSLTMDHLCRVRLCVRPDHLEQVTMRVNLLRGENFAAVYARRDACSHGHKYADGEWRWKVEKGYRYRLCDACQRERNHRRYPNARRAPVSGSVGEP